MRYSKEDDILLAKHFANKPEGTSDQIFQAFAKLVSVIAAIYGRSLTEALHQYPHHPWKGWQEHYRIHKAKIDHLMQEEGVLAGTSPVPALENQIINGGGEAGAYRPS